MALIIKGDMPTCCYDKEKDKYCLFWNCRACRYGDTRPSDCPILDEIPDRHGRLIDADKLTKTLEYWKYSAMDRYCTMTISNAIVKEILSQTPTVLEAST